MSRRKSPPPANLNTPPRLSGGNTIRQAEKPSRAAVTVPYIPGTLSPQIHDAVCKENERLRIEKFNVEKQLADVSTELQRCRDIITSLQRTNRRFAARIKQPSVKKAQ